MEEENAGNFPEFLKKIFIKINKHYLCTHKKMRKKL
jgi:hypothetical protein